MSYKFLGFALVTILMIQVVNMSYAVNSFNSNLDYRSITEEQETQYKKRETVAIEEETKIKLREKAKLREAKALEKDIIEEQFIEQKIKDFEVKIIEEQKKVELARQKKLEEEKIQESIRTNPTLTTQTTKPAVGAVAQAITGTKEDWLIASGIPKSDWTYVDFIVKKESSWNPKAINKSSGACGLAQALPCAKTGCANYADPVCSLKWQYSYVKARYGGYAGAYKFWLDRNWY